MRTSGINRGSFKFSRSQEALGLTKHTDTTNSDDRFVLLFVYKPLVLYVDVASVDVESAYQAEEKSSWPGCGLNQEFPRTSGHAASCFRRLNMMYININIYYSDFVHLAIVLDTMPGIVESALATVRAIGSLAARDRRIAG